LFAWRINCPVIHFRNLNNSVLQLIQHKKSVLFIVNPKSGTRSKKNIIQIIEGNVPGEYFDYQIAFTKARAHATELAAKAAAEGVEYIMAVGGDGTMNEVARSLLYTKSTLGIIPVGSGNGLARDLNIPLDPMNAIRLLVEGKKITIDSCTLNELPFFCTAGAGFDAHIGHLFARQKTRGFQTYVQTTLWEYTLYQPEWYRLSTSEKVVEKKAFLVSFANAAQYGNNAYIAPQANIRDGLIDVCLMRPFPTVQAMNLGIKLFNKTLHTSSYVETWKTAGATLERKTPGPVHVDGEPHQLEELLKVAIKPGSLQVLVP
jgi:diacylglycerol kinase (ATP)